MNGGAALGTERGPPSQERKIMSRLIKTCTNLLATLALVGLLCGCAIGPQPHPAQEGAATGSLDPAAENGGGANDDPGDGPSPTVPASEGGMDDGEGHASEADGLDTSADVIEDDATPDDATPDDATPDDIGPSSEVD